MRLRILIAISVPLILSSLLGARTAEYVVNAVGFKVVQIKMDINLKERYIQVKANSLATTKVFPCINNDYRVKYTGDFIPLEYERQVRQNNANGHIETKYDRQRNTAIQIGETENDSFPYDIDPTARDFFSFLAYLCENKPGSGTYVIDGNGVPWEAILELKGKEKLRTPIGQFMTSQYEIRLNPLSKTRVPYVDMFTNNLFNKETSIRIWIADQGIAVKAQVSKDLASTTWEILSFAQ